jgi:hypothetical protein
MGSLPSAGSVQRQQAQGITEVPVVKRVSAAGAATDVDSALRFGYRTIKGQFASLVPAGKRMRQGEAPDASESCGA